MAQTLDTMTEGQAVITDFESYGQGWTWTLVRGEYSNWTHRVEAVTYVFRTNQQGNGLWIDGKQVHGTMQFHMPYDRTAARRKARRFVQSAW